MVFHLFEQRQLALRWQETGLYCVCGEFAHLLQGECKAFVSQHILLKQIAAEHRRIVRVDRYHQAGFKVASNGMEVEVWAAAGADVTRNVQFQRDLLGSEYFQQLWVMLRGQGVADAFGAYVDRRPDALGADRLSRMSGKAQAGGLCFGIGIPEKIGGAAGFIAADTYPDDAGVQMA